MSACLAESPSWRYFGEIDTRNKFTGTSFEVRPTGVAHIELLLPTSAVLDPALYKDDDQLKAGKDRRLIEHYTFNKVSCKAPVVLMAS